MDHENDYDAYEDILTLVTPNGKILFNIDNYSRNKNLILLVIDSMCLGLILPEHIATRFSYIKNAIKYNEYTEKYSNGMKIIKVSSEWDTRKWSYSKIKKVLQYS